MRKPRGTLYFPTANGNDCQLSHPTDTGNSHEATLPTVPADTDTGTKLEPQFAVMRIPLDSTDADNRTYTNVREPARHAEDGRVA